MYVTVDEANPFFVKKVVVNDDANEKLQEESSKDKQENILFAIG